MEIQLAPLFAKRAAVVVGKKVLSREVYKKDQGLGLITDLLLSVSERADLRQWSLLPKSIQVARINVKPGRHNIIVKGNGVYETEVLCEFSKVYVHKGDKRILNCRGF